MRSAQFSSEFFPIPVREYGEVRSMPRSMTCLLLCLALAGCGGAANSTPLPKTEPVTGTVTLDDEPLDGANVTFIPTGNTKGIECSGRTDSAGVYTPQQVRGEDGVPAGSYKVVISRFLRNGQPVDPNESGDVGGVLTESLPSQYSNPGTTELTAKVEPGGGEIDFNLQSKK
jgi:hypothetical protein